MFCRVNKALQNENATEDMRVSFMTIKDLDKLDARKI